MVNNDISRAVEFLRAADCRCVTCADCQGASAALFGEGNENALCALDDKSDAKPWRRLADLIEPEPERTCRNVGGEEWGFKCSECGGHTHGSPFHAPDSERDDLARRMSELFGIEDGAIASLHGSVPRYCPNCGAKVVEP